MNKKRWIGIFAFLLVSACLFLLPSAHKVKGDITDFSQIAPVLRQTEPYYTKAYQSNIPSAFYDSSVNYGSQTRDSYEFSTPFLDLISEDGQTNYAKEEYIRIPYGMSVSFYLETGFINWYNDGANPVAATYEFNNNNESSTIDYSIDTYSDATGDYVNVFTFDSENTQYVLNDNSVFTYDGNDLVFDTTYHMPKVTITGNSSGIAKITINYYEGSNADAQKSFDLWVICTNEATGAYFDDVQLTTYFDSGDALYSYLYLESFDEAYYAIPYELSQYYSLYTARYAVIGSESYSVSLSSDSDRVVINNNQMYFIYPGEYDITLTMNVELATASQWDGTQEIVYGTRVVHFLVYSQVDFNFYDGEGNLFDASIPVSYADLPLELVPFTPNYDNYSSQFTLSYEVLDEEETAIGDLDDLNSVGTFSIVASIRDNSYQDFVNNANEGTIFEYEPLFGDEMEIEVVDYESQYPTPLLNFNGDDLTFENNMLSLSELQLCLFGINNYDEIIAAGGELAVSIPGITLIQNIDEYGFGLEDLFEGEYELIASVYYDTIQQSKSNTYTLTVHNDLSFSFVYAEEWADQIQIAPNEEARVNVVLFGTEDYYTLPYELHISIPSYDQNLTVTNPSYDEFVVYSATEGDYVLNVIVLDGDNGFVELMTLPIKVASQGMSLIFHDEYEDPIDTVDVEIGGEEVSVYPLISLDGEEELINAPYSFALAEEVPGVIFNTYDGYFSLEGSVEGNYEIAINLLYTDPNSGEVTTITQSTLGVYVYEPMDPDTFYFGDANGTQVPQITLNQNDSAELYLFAFDGEITIQIDSEYTITFAYSDDGVMQVVAELNQNDYYFVRVSSLDNIGTYTLTANIMWEDQVHQATLQVVIETEDEPTYYFVDDEGTPIDALILAQNDEAYIKIYYHLAQIDALIPGSAEVELVANSENVTVTPDERMQDGLNGSFLISSNGVAGNYILICTIFDNDHHQVITLNVNIEDDAPVGSMYSVITDEAGDEISGLVKLSLEESATFSVHAYVDITEIQLVKPFSIDVIDSGSLVYDVDGADIIISDNVSPIVGSLLIKVLYNGVMVDSLVLTYQVGEMESSLPEPEGDFYFENYEYVAMGEEMFAIPIIYEVNGSASQYTGSDLNVEIVNSYLNNGSISFNSERNQLEYYPYSSGYEQVTCLFIYRGVYLSKQTIYLRTVITTESIETAFAEGAVIQALLSDEYVLLSVPSQYEEAMYYGERYAVAMDRNICLVDSYPERELYVRLNNIGSTDVYMIIQSEGSQIVLKSTIIVSQEEPHIDIDVRREGDAEGAISKLDNLIFSLNRLGFVFSDDLNYEWILDDTIVSNKANYQTKLSEGTHVLKLRLTDNKLHKSFEAERTLKIAAVAGQQHQLAFEENEIYLVMLKNQYDLQVLLDGMIANEYTYEWTTDNDTVALFNSGSSKATILPNHAGTTSVYVFVDVGVGEEKIISAMITVVVEKVEEIGYQLSQEFPKPGKPFDVIFTVNGRDDCKNADFACTLLENGTEIEANMDGNKCHFENPVTAKYELKYRLGNLENTATVKVSNFNFKEFLITIFPFVMIGLVLAVIAYTLVVRGLNPYRNITKAVNQMDDTFNKEIAKNENSPSVSGSMKAFKKLRSQSHKLLGKINYFSDEGFDGLDVAIKSVITMHAIFDSLVHEGANLSETDCKEALEKTYNQNFKESKHLISQAIDSQLHYQKQVKENNLDDNVKKEKVKKQKVDYKKELYRNGVLNDVNPDSDSDQ